MSSNQDIKTNAATLVCRRGVRHSCFVLHGTFPYTLPWKRLCRLVIVLSWLNEVTRRPLIQIIVGLPFFDLSNMADVYWCYFFTRIVDPDPNLQIYFFLVINIVVQLEQKRQKVLNFLHSTILTCSEEIMFSG